MNIFSLGASGRTLTAHYVPNIPIKEKQKLSHFTVEENGNITEIALAKVFVNGYPAVYLQGFKSTPLGKEVTFALDESYNIHLENTAFNPVVTLKKIKKCFNVESEWGTSEFHQLVHKLAGCIRIDERVSFFEWLYSHEDAIGSYRLELVLACLRECRDKEFEDIIWKKYKIAEFQISLFRVHWHAIVCFVSWHYLRKHICKSAQ